jgi:hypothetical protein
LPWRRSAAARASSVPVSRRNQTFRPPRGSAASKRFPLLNVARASSESVRTGRSPRFSSHSKRSRQPALWHCIANAYSSPNEARRICTSA